MDYTTLIEESLDHIIDLERSTSNLQARDRIRFIRYLKSGQAKTQEEAGMLIGIGLRQSQRLYKLYRTEGLSRLLQPSPPRYTGKLSEEQREKLLDRLKDDDIATLAQAQDWMEQEFGVYYTLGGVWALFKRLKVKLKTGRPSNVRKDPQQGEAFKKKFPTLADEFDQHIWWADEMRYGTRTDLKRRWTPRKHRPQCPVVIGYEFGYLYTCINPYSGDLFCMMLPRMTIECFEMFVQALGQQLDRRKKTMLILDRASNHRWAKKPWRRLSLEFLPPASPELNPVERFFKELRKHLSNQVFNNIAEVEDRIIEILKQYWSNPQLIMRLTQYPYLITPSKC